MPAATENLINCLGLYMNQIKTKILLTFAAFGEANDICNAEGQTNYYNKKIICLKSY